MPRIYNSTAITNALSEPAERTLLMLAVHGAFLFSTLLSPLKKFKIIQTMSHINSRVHSDNCCCSTPSSQWQIVSGYQMQLNFVTRIFFHLFSEVLPADCVKL